MTMTFRPPTAGDIRHVAANMRSEDVLEVAASHGHTPIQALAWSVTESTRAFTALWCGEPVCIFGYADDPCGAASVWLLGTPKLVAPGVRRSFLAHARRILDEWAELFGLIYNFVDAEAQTTRRWLAWLGFIELRTVEYGTAQLPFVQVIKTRCATPQPTS